jgi:hypothetical protein
MTDPWRTMQSRATPLEPQTRTALNPQSRDTASKCRSEQPRIDESKGVIMKRYSPSKFRPAFGIAAVALSALTMMLAVGVPANLSNGGSDATTLAATRTAPAATEVAVNLGRIDVTGVRDTNVAASPRAHRGRV